MHGPGPYSDTQTVITVQVRMVTAWWGAQGGAPGGCSMLLTRLGSPCDQEEARCCL